MQTLQSRIAHFKAEGYRVLVDHELRFGIEYPFSNGGEKVVVLGGKAV